jgi:hypothetical protein
MSYAWSGAVRPARVAVAVSLLWITVETSAVSKPAATPPPKATPISDEANVVGRWIDPVLGALVAIKRIGRTYVLLNEPNNGRPYTLPLRLHAGSGGKRFDISNSDFGDNVVVLPDGRLDMRDREGEARILEVAPGGADNSGARAAAVNGAQQTLLCRHDLNCTLGGKIQDAVAQCQSAVESHSRWNFRWSAGRSPFAGYRWNPKAPVEKGLVDFYGDRLELQNGFGAWMNYQYVCTYDTNGRRVFQVAMHTGHQAE